VVAQSGWLGRKADCGLERITKILIYPRDPDMRRIVVTGTSARPSMAASEHCAGIAEAEHPRSNSTSATLPFQRRSERMPP
jgi:hypothetical protein